MWQQTVKPFVEAGELTVIGVVQEQHPERAKLYRQWRQLDWPIFVDSLNLLNIKVVPIPVAIDESGIVRHRSIWPNQLEQKFLSMEFTSKSLYHGFNVANRTDLNLLSAMAQQPRSARAWRNVGDACFLEQLSNHLSANRIGHDDSLSDAVESYQQASKLDPKDGVTHFRLGVALRARYETPHRQPDDAQRAIEQWGYALAADPNQYIWRRRIQQYGPRLDKPYNFYFWVDEARKEIISRGETPVTLPTEPRGSEIAHPVRGIGGKGQEEKVGGAPVQNTICSSGNRSTADRIQVDARGLVKIDTMVTPARVRPGHRVRVRSTFRVNPITLPWWNNEGDDLTVCFDPPDGLSLGEGAFTFANPPESETREDRVIEFELLVSRQLAPGKHDLPARALYYVCGNKGGKCHYLRQDFKITLQVDPHAPILR